MSSSTSHSFFVMQGTFPLLLYFDCSLCCPSAGEFKCMRSLEHLCQAGRTRKEPMLLFSWELFCSSARSVFSLARSRACSRSVGRRRRHIRHPYPFWALMTAISGPRTDVLLRCSVFRVRTRARGLALKLAANHDLRFVSQGYLENITDLPESLKSSFIVESCNPSMTRTQFIGKYD